MSNQRKKVLGIDYGDRRVGLAMAEVGSIAVPYKILFNKNLETLIDDLDKIIKEENISIVVAGLPHSLTGYDNERIKITENFIKLLSKYLLAQNIPVKTVDEQLTSKLFYKMGVSQEIDKHAATAILDTFLSQTNE